MKKLWKNKKNISATINWIQKNKLQWKTLQIEKKTIKTLMIYQKNYVLGIHYTGWFTKHFYPLFFIYAAIQNLIFGIFKYT